MTSSRLNKVGSEGDASLFVDSVVIVVRVDRKQADEREVQSGWQEGQGGCNRPDAQREQRNKERWMDGCILHPVRYDFQVA